jgi:hypothetical protein
MEKKKKPVNSAVYGRLSLDVIRFVRKTGLASLILYSLLITQESPSRLRRDCFVFSFALESKLSALLKRQNPQLSLRVSCSSTWQDNSRTNLSMT